MDHGPSKEKGTDGEGVVLRGSFSENSFARAKAQTAEGQEHAMVMLTGEVMSFYA